MATTVAVDHTGAPQADSGLSNNITRINRELYKAAIGGDFNKFAHDQNIEGLLTPKKNTILHVHLTSTTTEATQRAPQPFAHQIVSKFLDLMRIKNKENSVSENFVEQIIHKCGGLVLLPNAKGETPLHLAARYGHSAISKLLLERAKTFPRDFESGIGAEIKLIRATTRENNETALHEAVRYHHIEVVEMLLEMDPGLSSSANLANETPLYMAAERRYKLVVRKILEKVESPAYTGLNGRTALHAAVINSDIEMTREFLKNEHLSATIKHADNKGWVPLHYAVKTGNKHMTKLLLKQDENTAYMQDDEGRTALHIAAHCGHSIIMKMIIRYHPDCSELVDNKDWNALHHALHGERPGLMNIIGQTLHWERPGPTNIIMQALPLSNLYNEKDVDGNTPLHHYAKSPHYHWQLVAHNRIDRQVLNKKGQTALDVAYDSVEVLDIHRREGKISQLRHAGAIRSQRPDVNTNVSGPSLAFTREAKESRLIVAALIATVTFAAAFTLPGGTFQDGEQQGKPILGHRASFKAFVVFDTIALVMSASAVFIHLFSPLVNKSKWVDYYLSEIAFSFTLVAVATMILAFGTGTYAVLGSSSIGITTIIIGLSFFLVFNDVKNLTFRGYFLLTFKKILRNIFFFSIKGGRRARQASLSP